MVSLRARGPRTGHQLRRHAASLLLVAAWPVFASGQTASANDPAGSTGASTIASTPAAAPSAPPAQVSPRPTPQLVVGLLEEPEFLTHGLELAEQFASDAGSGVRKNGFYPELSNMNTGAGFISFGPGYQHEVFGNRAFVDMSAAVSWHFYKMVQARLEFPNTTDSFFAGVQGFYEDNTQVGYFGIGPQGEFNEHTQYRLKATEIGGYASVKPNSWFSVGAELGWLFSPEISPPAGTFNPDFPYAGDVYPNDPAMNLPDQPSFLRSEVSFKADTLNSHSYPTSGGQYWAALTHWSDQSGPAGFSFSHFEAQGVQMVPIVGKRLLLGLRGWTVHSLGDDINQTPFYLLPAIGGSSTIRAFDSFQFHDLNSITTTAELRLAVWTHVYVAGFVDAGNVAARYSDLNLDQTAVGAGVRLHTTRQTIGRLDVAHGSNGWQVMWRTSDPFKLSRVTRKLGTVPFAP